MSGYVLRITSPNHATKHVAIKRLVAVRAQHGAEYTLLDATSQQPVADATLLRSGSSLAVQTGGKKILYISKFFNSGIDATFHTVDTPAAAAVSAEPVAYQPAPQVAATSAPAVTQTTAPEYSPPAQSGGWFDGWGLGANSGAWLLGGVGLLGLGALAAAGGDDDDSDNDNVSPPVADTTAPSFTSATSATALDDASGASQQVYTAAANDENTVTYSLQQSGDAAAFSIDNATGSVTLVADPDYASQSSYQFTVVATDSAGNASEQTVTLAINAPVDPVTNPKITDLAIVADSEETFEQLNAGDSVDIQLSLDEVTYVQGTPELAVTVGNQAALAVYVSGSGSQNLLFRYTVESGHNDSDGISVAANSLSLNSGSLKNAAGYDALLTHSSLAANRDYRVDTVNPESQLINPVSVQLGKGGGDDFSPIMTPLGSNGDFVVVWRAEDQPGGEQNDFSVYVQKFAQDGSTQGGVVKLAALGKHPATDFMPSVSALGDNGEFVVSWVDYDAEDNRSIVVQKFDSNGDAATSPETISSITSLFLDKYSPKVAEVGSNGEFVLAWDQLDREWSTLAEYSPSRVLVQKFNADGSTTGHELVKLKAAGTLEGNSYDVQLTSLGGNGEFAVTWYSDSNIERSVFVQQFDSDANVVGDAVLLEGGLDDGDFSPQIRAVGSNGDYVVAWSGMEAQNDTRIFVQKFNAEGSKVQQLALQLDGVTNSSGINSNPVIASLADNGEFVIVWQGDNADGKSAVFVQRFDENGATAGESVALNTQATTDLYAQNPVVSALGSQGDFVVVWQDQSFEGGSSIFVQKFNADGGMADYQQIELQPPANNQGNDVDPHIVALGEQGEFAVSWQGEDKDGEQTIFVQKFDRDGQLSREVNGDQTIESGDRVTLQSNEAGVGYLVHDSLQVNQLSDITDASPGKWMEGDVTADTDLALSSTSLIPGKYYGYSADAAGNLSAVTENSFELGSIAEITLTSPNGPLQAGDSIQLTVDMHKTTTVNTAGGTPQLGLDIGGEIVQASYTSGSNSKSLLFEYTISAAQNDSDGVSVVANAISLNGAEIQDLAGNDAHLINHALVDNADYKVDNQAPEASLVAIGTVGLGDSVLAFADEPGTLYLVNKNVSVTQLNDITSADSSLWQQASAGFGAPADFSTQGLVAGEYQLYGQDNLGNFSAQPAADSVTLSDTLDTDNVVFDLVNGQSSAHSGRSFEADTAYTIYVRVDSDAAEVNFADDGRWGSWSGADNLGDDDKLILVGNGSEVRGNEKNVVNDAKSTDAAFAWLSSNGKAFDVAPLGAAHRLYSDDSNGVILWSGTWSKPNSGQALTSVYRPDMLDSGVLTSQGLI